MNEKSTISINSNTERSKKKFKIDVKMMPTAK